MISITCFVVVFLNPILQCFIKDLLQKFEEKDKIE